jgi:exodeoxyribonuclease V beta subunit
MLSLLHASPWAKQAGDIQAWLQQVVTQPLLSGGVCLREVRTMRAELEFWMPIKKLDTHSLDNLLQQHLWPGQPRPALQPRQLEGLILGFADLVLESCGRYEVLDYKSNRLGPGPEHYTTASLQTAVLEHRYDVQAAIYLLALHRLLQSRLGDRYKLQQHLGAAHFLFLRGIDQADGHLISIHPDTVWLDPLNQMFERAEKLV